MSDIPPSEVLIGLVQDQERLEKEVDELRQSDSALRARLKEVSDKFVEETALRAMLEKRARALEVSEAELERLAFFLEQNLPGLAQQNDGPIPLAIRLLEMVTEAAPTIISLAIKLLQGHLKQAENSELIAHYEEQERMAKEEA